MPSHPAVRYFTNGVTGVSQWTGKEFKQMEKLFLGIIAGAEGVTMGIMAAARALMEFIFRAQYPSHTESTLKDMEDALADFHKHKEAFVKAGVYKNFNIHKIHVLSHYVPMIREMGSADGYDTELPERLDIDLAKSGYRASSKVNYAPQMVAWIQRQERLWKLEAYIRWVDPDALGKDDSDNGEDDCNAGERELRAELDASYGDEGNPQSGSGHTSFDVTIILSLSTLDRRSQRSPHFRR